MRREVQGRRRGRPRAEKGSIPVTLYSIVVLHCADTIAEGPCITSAAHLIPMQHFV